MRNKNLYKKKRAASGNIQRKKEELKKYKKRDRWKHCM